MRLFERKQQAVTHEHRVANMRNLIQQNARLDELNVILTKLKEAKTIQQFKNIDAAILDVQNRIRQLYVTIYGRIPQRKRIDVMEVDGQPASAQHKKQRQKQQPQQQQQQQKENMEWSDFENELSSDDTLSSSF